MLRGQVVNEIIFVVEDAAEGGYVARAVGESIFTEADDIKQLHARTREAVLCHFDEGKAPQSCRWCYTSEFLMTI